MVNGHTPLASRNTSIGHRGFSSKSQLSPGPRAKIRHSDGQSTTSWSSFCAEFAARQQDGYAWTGTAMPMVTLAKQRHAEDYRVFCRRFIQKANQSFKMFQDIHLWLFEFKWIRYGKILRYGKMFRPLQSEKVQASPLFRAYMALIQGLRCPCSWSGIWNCSYNQYMYHWQWLIMLNICTVPIFDFMLHFTFLKVICVLTTRLDRV